MNYIKHTTPRLLIADEGKKIRSRSDEYIPEHKDEEGNLISEHKPYYSSVIFLGEQIQTFEDINNIYVEEVVSDENKSSD